MKKRLIATLLLVILTFGLLATTGCSNEYIMTANGEKMDAGYYSFYVHWQRDYYKELLKSYGYDITTNMDTYFTSTETVQQCIVSTAKTQYLSFVAVTKKFEELNLSLTEEQLAEINTLYNDEWLKTYGEAGMKNILKTLGLKKDQFMEILSVQAKSDAILEYYYGENGVTPITKQDKKDYYNENYHRLKYVLLTKIDDNNKDLPADEVAYKRGLAEQLRQQLENGATFEDLIVQHSEDYSKITDDMSAEDKAAAETNNQQAITEGLICNQDGVFNQALYVYYDICLDSKILEELDKMEVGDVSIVEIDSSIWLLKKYDLNENASYFEKREEDIYQAMYADDFQTMYTMWLAELDYSFNDATLKELDPKNFTDLFSDVYNLEDGTVPEKTLN